MKRLNRLIEECRRHPFDGIGKPEPLGQNLAGFWSRRLTEGDRLVYRLVGEGAEEALEIVQWRGHY